MKAKPRPLLLLAVTVGFLFLSVLGLSVALTIVALRDTPVLVVPGVRENQIAVPEEVPDSAVRKFALLYLAYFDDYTPETIEARSTWILRFVAPEFRKDVVRGLTERAAYVVRAKKTSHLTLPLPSAEKEIELIRRPDGVIRVLVTGALQVYIASEFQDEQRIRYTLDLKPALPQDKDSFGFVVVSQTMQAEDSRKPEEAAHARR